MSKQQTLFEAETAGEKKPPVVQTIVDSSVQQVAPTPPADITPELSSSASDVTPEGNNGGTGHLPVSGSSSSDLHAISSADSSLPDIASTETPTVTETALPSALSSGRNDDTNTIPSLPAAANSIKVTEPRILYCGYMKTPFTYQDRDYLERFYPVEILDFSEVAQTFSQMPTYLIQCFTRILPGVLRNDVIWIWFHDYPAFPLVVLAKVFGKKTVICHGGAELYPPNDIGYGFQMMKKRGWVARWLARNADMNIVMSEAYEKIMHDCVPGVPVYIIPGCIDASLYKPDYRRKEDLAVTAYCDYKLSRLLKGIPYFEAAQKKSKYKMEALFRKPHREMIATFLRAKVYCQLSYTEQFGMSLLEAMACGCVPVVTDRGGMPSIVGKTGIIVPYGDVDATVHAIRVAMRMSGEAARKRAAEFTVEKKIVHMHKVIETVWGKCKRTN